MYKWSNRSLRRMEGVNNQLTACATRALSKSKYDMTIPWLGGLRTAEEQNGLFPDNSKCDGYKRKSYHQSGYALDIIPVYKTYKNTRAMNYFANLMLIEYQIMIREGIAEGQMTWGGTFGSQGWDKPHFEIRV